MNFRPKRRRAVAVDVTSLIDVVFLLLIFFMVSTTFERESQLLVELPEANGEKVEENHPELEITIDRSGTFYVNQLEVINTTVETLQQAILKAVGDKRNIPVVISADARTPHQSVITAMDAASQLGLMRMTFSTHLPDTQ